MSNHLLSLAWTVPLSPPAKLLLVALADRADSTGKSWPSVDMLCAQTGLSRASVERHAAALVAASLMTRRRRRHRSAEYVLSETAMIHAASVNGSLAAVVELPTPDVQKSHAETSTRETSHAETSHSDGPDVSQCDMSKENPNRTITTSPIGDEAREDVERLCSALVEHRVRLGCKRPTITKTWRTQARLLLDVDTRPLNEALAILDWSQNHIGRNGFSWKSNIQSMPTFREKYDQLRLQRQNDPQAVSAPTDPRAFVNDCWERGSVQEIRKVYDIGYIQPDNPGLGPDAYLADVLRPYNRCWIKEHADSIVARLTQGIAS